jgi:hypothetical protein
VSDLETLKCIDLHVCNSGTSLWNLEEEGKEKRMIGCQQY